MASFLLPYVVSALNAFELVPDIVGMVVKGVAETPGTNHFEGRKRVAPKVYFN